MEFPRSHCLYHPKEPITNFCLEPSCLLPLCPSCVCTHIDFHQKRGVHVKFDNINETFNTCVKQITSVVERFQEERDRATHLQASIDRLYAKVGDIIFQARLEVRELVDRVFEQVERDTMNTIDRQCQKGGVHSKDKLEGIVGRIGEGVREVGAMFEDVRSEKALQTVIVWNGEKKKALEKTLAELDQQFQLNYEFDPRITINTSTFDIVAKSISQIVEMKFNLPQQHMKPQHTERSILRDPSKDRLLTPIVNKRVIPTPQQQIMYFPKEQSKLVLNRVRSPSQQSSSYFSSAPPSQVVHHHYVVVPQKTDENWPMTQSSTTNITKRSEAIGKDRPKSRGLILSGSNQKERKR